MVLLILGILPTLPSSWSSNRARGNRTRGNRTRENRNPRKSKSAQIKVAEIKIRGNQTAEIERRKSKSRKSTSICSAKENYTQAERFSTICCRVHTPLASRQLLASALTHGPRLRPTILPAALEVSWGCAQAEATVGQGGCANRKSVRDLDIDKFHVELDKIIVNPPSHVLFRLQ